MRPIILGYFLPTITMEINAFSFQIGLRHVLSCLKLGLDPTFHDAGTFDGFGKREQSFFLYLVDFSHWTTIWGPPLKIKILKIGLRSDLSWPKLGLEPKFHEPGTFGGFGKREQTHRHTHKIHVL